MPPNAPGGGGGGFSSGARRPETASPARGGKAKKPSKMKRLLNSASRRAKKSGGGASASVVLPKIPLHHMESDEMTPPHTKNGAATENHRHHQQRWQQEQQPKPPPEPTASLEEIVIRLRADVEVRDRKYHLKTYPRCFVGSEVVDYLVEIGIVPSRARAVEVGRELMTKWEAFEHVTGEHDFRDEYLFYQFKDDDHPPAEGETVPNYQRLSSAGDQSKDSSNGGIIKMDKYGFLLDDDRASAHENESSLDQSANNLARLRASDAKRWENILEKVPNAKFNHSSANIASYATTQSKVKYYARRGLPDRLRQKAWTVLTGVDVIMNENPGEYDALVAKAEEEYRKMHDLDSAADLSDSCGDGFSASGGGGTTSRSTNALGTIERDIHRTFPKHYLFKQVEDRDEDDGSTRSGGVGSSAYDSEIDDDESQAGSDAGHDRIAEVAESTGQDPKQVVETKKQLFNQSMDALMQGRCGGLQNVDGIGIANIGANEREDRREYMKKASTEKASPGAGSNQSLDIYEEDVDDDDLDKKTRSRSSSQALGMGHGQDALRRVLRAYSTYDGEVGYCQGMNFITAMFLTFLTEEEAFWLLVVVMNEEPYKLRELFGEDMAGTHEVLYIAEKLLAQFLPKLSKHMEEESVHVSMFVTQWLLTVYTSTFPFDLVSRVWDSFLVEGWKVVYRVMLSLLEYASKDILELKFEDILHYFRQFPSRVKGQDIMAGSLKIALKRKHIQKHVKEWRRHAGGGDGPAKQRGMSRFHTIRRRASDDNSSISSATFTSREIALLKMTVPNPAHMLKKSPKEIVVEDLSEPLLPVIGRMKFAVLLHNVLTPEECSELIDRAEEHGFEDASIYDRRTNRVHRNCTRYVADDAGLADNWFERISHALTGTPHERKLINAPWIRARNNGTATGKEEDDRHYRAVGLNERLRLLRYRQGQFFHSHNDAVFIRRGPDDAERSGETSSVSVHVYLNQKFKGGLTTFRGQGRHLDVKPRTGSILVFEHDILHEGQRVTQGKKYVVRTDVMYSDASVGFFTSDASGTTLTQQL